MQSKFSFLYKAKRIQKPSVSGLKSAFSIISQFLNSPEEAWRSGLEDFWCDSKRYFDPKSIEFEISEIFKFLEIL